MTHASIRLPACPQCDSREKVHACARQHLPEEGAEFYCDRCGHHWFRANKRDLKGDPRA